MKISVSILTNPYTDKEAIEMLNATDADFLHVDVLDGHFVPGIKHEYVDLQYSTKPLDVHLMVSKPFEFINKYNYKLTEYMTISYEIGEDIDELLDYIKSLGLKCGLAIKPSTPIREIEQYLPKLDKVLLLLVEPGMGGQKMLKGSLYRIDELNALRKEKGYQFEIWVDGGINKETKDDVKNADGLVVGSYILKSENFQTSIDEVRL